MAEVGAWWDLSTYKWDGVQDQGDHGDQDVKMHLTKIFKPIFALAERRPTSATLEHTIFPYCQGSSRGAQQRPSLLEFITQITCAYYTDDADDDGDDDYDLS